MSSVTRTVFYRELFTGLYSPTRFALFAVYLAMVSVFMTTALQLGEGKFWTLSSLWTLSAGLPLPIIVSLVTMPLFAGERSAGTYEMLALLPTPMRKVVIGKFASTFLFVVAALAIALIPWMVLSATLGTAAPSATMLCAPIACLLLHAFSWTALGVLTSSISRRPWLAAAGTLLVGIALMAIWAAFSQLSIFPHLRVSPYPIWDELLDASAGRVMLHSIVFHIMFGLWCLFLSVQVLEARR